MNSLSNLQALSCVLYRTRREFLLSLACNRYDTCCILRRQICGLPGEQDTGFSFVALSQEKNAGQAFCPASSPWRWLRVSVGSCLLGGVSKLSTLLCGKSVGILILQTTCACIGSLSRGFLKIYVQMDLKQDKMLSKKISCI